VHVELDDETYRLLEEQARSSNVSVEVLAMAAIAAQTRITTSPISDEFRAVVREIVDAYRPVFHRLAE